MKIFGVIKRLAAEFRAMHKPDGPTLLKDTARIAGMAAAGAVILKAVDTGFAALLSLIL